jgi:hypothetical protein
MKSVKLKFPIKDPTKKGVLIEELTPGRLKVKHFELLPASLLAKKDGKITFTTEEMIPLFEELKPFLAGIFRVNVKVIQEVDFDDLESVFECLEQVLPSDEKKN